jgi:four helix bundle protein
VDGQQRVEGWKAEGLLAGCDGLRFRSVHGSERENSETETSLDFALDCGYIAIEEHAHLVALNGEVGKMLGSMIRNPEPFLIRPKA